ncbi:hypothetical protein E2C01_057901 [Portunus trituberculatus]|uniref:Uncharacterized protein n=1 Tax=Portunus trituberculatus TaxID=210409 RepID=A0A5B7H381_PORTR|nr:hypothetical protein [Portunus trituberculatus]
MSKLNSSVAISSTASISEVVSTVTTDPKKGPSCDTPWDHTDSPGVRGCSQCKPSPYTPYIPPILHLEGS